MTSNNSNNQAYLTLNKFNKENEINKTPCKGL